MSSDGGSKVNPFEILHGSMKGYAKCVKRPEGSCRSCRRANADYKKENARLKGRPVVYDGPLLRKAVEVHINQDFYSWANHHASIRRRLERERIEQCRSR